MLPDTSVTVVPGLFPIIQRRERTVPTVACTAISAAAATAYIAELGKARVYRLPIVTTLEPLTKFYEAEAYHQNYLDQHLTQPYIEYNDLPNLEELKRRMPEICVAQ